jgi:small subunit ribosomal protein S20
MPHTKSAWKRMRKSEEARDHNRVIIRKLKIQLKAFLVAVKSGDKTKANEEMTKSAKMFDRAGTKGYIHRNKAARVKSRMAARLARIGQPVAVAAK